MSDAMSAEFGTVAGWTAEAAMELGVDYYLPAACRGSGSPAALDHLLGELAPSDGDLLLDCGAGLGGPAAYAARKTSLRPILVEPEGAACRAGRRLFGLPVVRASGSELPFADASFDLAWSLGVLCTMQEQLELLVELRRVVRAGGRIGLLVFVERKAGGQRPEGNEFPTEAELADLVARADLQVLRWRSTSELPPIPDDWQRREDAVHSWLDERHARDPAWLVAERQSQLMGGLLSNGTVTGELLTSCPAG